MLFNFLLFSTSFDLWSVEKVFVEKRLFKDYLGFLKELICYKKINVKYTGHAIFHSINGYATPSVHSHYIYIYIYIYIWIYIYIYIIMKIFVYIHNKEVSLCTSCKIYHIYIYIHTHR